MMVVILRGRNSPRFRREREMLSWKDGEQSVAWRLNFIITFFCQLLSFNECKTETLIEDAFVCFWCYKIGDC